MTHNLQPQSLGPFVLKKTIMDGGARFYTSEVGPSSESRNSHNPFKGHMWQGLGLGLVGSSVECT